MRILIGGEDEVAYRLVESLMADHAVTLICPEETADANRISRMDAQYVAGSMTSASVLDQAHIKEAELFVACSCVDERNIVEARDPDNPKERYCLCRNPVTAQIVPLIPNNGPAAALSPP